MSNLSSRKLAACIAGLVAICTLAGFAVFAGPMLDFDKALVAVSGITLTAIGAQALVDGSGKGGSS